MVAAAVLKDTLVQEKDGSKTAFHSDLFIHGSPSLKERSLPFNLPLVPS